MSQERLNILLIEHDPGFTQTIGEMLGQARELSADVSSAPGLQEGFSAINRKHFDVVVLDVAVPDGAGLANISLLKAEAPRLPIIAAGDADNETVAVEAVQAGAQDYLVKNQLTPGWLERSIRYAIERHRTDMTLLAAEEKYHGIFDHLVEGIFETTPDGRYLLANAALARIYGYATPEELMNSLTDIGQRLYVQDDRRDEFVRLMQERDLITGFESQIYRKDGSIIWISENCRAVRDAQGKLLYYEGTVEDITERRNAEEQIRRATAELSRSREELRAKNALMQESLRTAREIQLTLLPQQYPVFPPNVPPENSAFQFLHRYEAAETVSGDFFTVSALSETEAGVFICDVTGHGVRAALVTAMIRALTEELKPFAHDPGFFLYKLNRDLCSILKNTGSPMLTTAFYAVADCRSGLLRYANAGHPNPLLVRRS